MENAVANRHLVVWRDDVNLVRFYRRFILRIDHRHFGRARQDVAEGALAQRIEVWQHHIGHAQMWRQNSQEGGAGFKPTSRSSDAHDGKFPLCVRLRRGLAVLGFYRLFVGHWALRVTCYYRISAFAPPPPDAPARGRSVSERLALGSQ